MFKQTIATSSLAAALLVGGCATTPEPDDRVERLRDQYEMVAATEQANEYAPLKLDDAKKSLAKLESLIANDAEPAEVEQQIYIVERRLQIATQTSRMKQADEMVDQASDRRNSMLLTARTQRAEEAEARARLAQEEALAAQARADQMSERAKKLELELENISTEKTDRGLVLTLGNILFEVDKATIKAGSQRTLERVADFLREYPDRDVMIEGFTDSTGSESYNQDLSERRARSVQDTLVSNGVSAARIKTRGYGEAHPVASNDNPSGRLQNRRVEIIIANSGETVSERQ
ncbi:OmpA family protein [Gilvimarinus chinensis]|uniref:OmpA family protein n=1 Tax=Gilvimarinus chinensis TaxID=396005 RepID=UPI00036533DB|nr:OmpA family protein [Gilvimarinus chinensis]